MKLLLAVHHFPPRYIGGSEAEVLRVARALQGRGHQVRVVCVEEVDRGAAGEVRWIEEDYGGVAVRRLSLNLRTLSARDEYDNEPIGRHFERLLAQDPPDLLHLFSGYLLSASPLTAAHARGVPTVVNLMDLWFLCPRISMQRSDGQLSTLPIDPAICAQCLGEEQRWYRIPGRFVPGLMAWYWRHRTARIRLIEERHAFLRGVLDGTDAIISGSQFLRSMLVQASMVRPGRITFLRQSRDFSHRPAFMFEKSRADRLRVGYLGQIAPNKGLHVLVEAVRQLRDKRLTLEIHGDLYRAPEYVRGLRAAARGDERIHFAGPYLDDERLTDILRDLDVIVVPSVAYENSPNVILEAFAHKTPVIGSNFGGIAELLIDGVNGLMFEAGDPFSLAAALERVLDDPDLLSRLRAGIPAVKSQEQEMAELEAIYQRVARG